MGRSPEEIYEDLVDSHQDGYQEDLTEEDESDLWNEAHRISEKENASDD